jgi:hypothetical protein
MAENTRGTMLKHNLEDYFKYHPPTTEERRVAHNQVNASALRLCTMLWILVEEMPKDADHELTVQYLQNSVSVLNNEVETIVSTFSDETAKKWAKHAATILRRDGIEAMDKESILMGVQQIRMFANQGVTMDSLESD